LLKESMAGPLNEDQPGFVQDIYASKKLMGLLNAILEYSQMKTGFTRLELEPVEVDAWLAASILPWRNRVATKGLTFALDIPAPLGRLWLDVHKGQQILVNLLSNAVKFTANGGVTLSACRVAQTQAVSDALPDAFAYYLEIQVRDTGFGFPANVLSRLFEPFDQNDVSLARSFDGIGLGLAMVKRLVDLHAGVVKVRNAPGQGACVTVWLPWRESAAQAVD
jgi:signal transduction histidine kinase